jgi:hypothetical protein
MRELYHYACRFDGDEEARSAALLAIYLFLDELRTEVYEDFSEACIAGEMDPDLVMERMPEELWHTVEDFVADHVVHQKKVAHRGFTFVQVGMGVA